MWGEQDPTFRIRANRVCGGVMPRITQNVIRLQQESMAGVREEPPRALVCPITLDLMNDPVMDANGHTFERSAIARVLVNRPGICPLTNERYPNGVARLTPNRALRCMIDAFREAAGEAACMFAW
jgi:hypothetical protein